MYIGRVDFGSRCNFTTYICTERRPKRPTCTIREIIGRTKQLVEGRHKRRRYGIPTSELQEAFGGIKA